MDVQAQVYYPKALGYVNGDGSSEEEQAPREKVTGLYTKIMIVLLITFFIDRRKGISVRNQRAYVKKRVRVKHCLLKRGAPQKGQLGLRKRQ